MRNVHTNIKYASAIVSILQWVPATVSNSLEATSFPVSPDASNLPVFRANYQRTGFHDVDAKYIDGSNQPDSVNYGTSFIIRPTNKRDTNQPRFLPVLSNNSLTLQRRQAVVDDGGNNPYISECNYARGHKHTFSRSKRYKSRFIGWLISTVSILVTLILCSTIPELQTRDNKILLCFLGTFECHLLGVVIWSVLTDSRRTATACITFTLINQYLFHSTLVWCNVQAIVLFWRFRRMPVTGQTNANDTIRSFALWCLYGWGVPLMSLTLTLLAELYAEKGTFFNPGMGECCWFNTHNKMRVMLYFYSCPSIILLLNVLLFVLTVIRLRKMEKGVRNVNKNITKQLFHLYVKLAVVMGLCWLLEVILWLIDAKSESWLPFDIFISLQGFYVFLVYVCKRRYIRPLLIKFRSGKLNWCSGVERSQIVQ